MFLSAGIGAVLASLVMWYFSPKEWALLYRAVHHKRAAGLALFTSCFVSVGISYSGIWLGKHVTATTFMVLGSATKMLVIIWGIVRAGTQHHTLTVPAAHMPETYTDTCSMRMHMHSASCPDP